jgi:hypothetical protein
MLVWGGAVSYQLSTGGLYGASEDLDEDGYCSPADCVAETTASTSYDTSLEPDPAFVRYYLVRPLAPNQGSWGLLSDGAERAVVCD